MKKKMKHHRISKNKNALQRMKVRPVVVLERGELDKKIFDLVLKKLYENSDRNTLHLENEIYAPSNVKLPANEAERIWEVMISSGWITPVIGFGNSGRVELTKSGYQLMAQFGGYSEYLNTINQPNQPQTIILPIQVQDDDSQEIPRIPGKSDNDKAAHKMGVRRSKYTRK
jgi:hypothetical protein